MARNCIRMTSMSYFGEQLGKAIEAKGLKRQDVAFDLRIDPAELSKVINGKKPPPKKFLDVFSNYDPLGLDYATLKAWDMQDKAPDVVEDAKYLPIDKKIELIQSLNEEELKIVLEAAKKRKKGI